MFFVIPQSLQPQSDAKDLKIRLDWGEPALTLIDVRSRDAFNVSRIQGAISLPMSELVSRAMMNFELIRDLYVYGSSDEKTAEAAAMLKKAGYQNVAELTGGITAWKAAGYPIEGDAMVIA